MCRGGIIGFSGDWKVDAEASAFFAKKYFGEINFMTRSHTDKEQPSSMFAFLHTYLKYSGKLMNILVRWVLPRLSVFYLPILTKM